MYKTQGWWRRQRFKNSKVWAAVCVVLIVCRVALNVACVSLLIGRTQVRTGYSLVLLTSDNIKKRRSIKNIPLHVTHTHNYREREHTHKWAFSSTKQGIVSSPCWRHCDVSNTSAVSCSRGGGRSGAGRGETPAWIRCLATEVRLRVEHFNQGVPIPYFCSGLLCFELKFIISMFKL